MWRWRATAPKPNRSNSAPSAAGSGAAYSTNSKPSVCIGLSQAILILDPENRGQSPISGRLGESSRVFFSGRPGRPGSVLRPSRAARSALNVSLASG